jgi:hypothetical protein
MTAPRRNPCVPEGVQGFVQRLLLPVVFAVALAGCVGGGQSIPARASSASTVIPTGRLEFAVRLWPRDCPFGALGGRCREATPSVRHYTLECGPAGGNHPNPRAACRAIADYLTRRNRYGRCKGLLTAGSTAVVSGTYARHPFHLRLTAGYSWCGQPPELLRDYWVLSTFPCSTRVLRTGGDYPQWPRATGCMIDAG